MNFIQEVINYIGSQPASTWTTLAAYLGGSTLVASLLQIVKHKFNFADAKKVLVFATGFFSFIAAFADFLLQSNATNPLPTIGHMTGLLIAGAVVVHRFAVSPAYYGLAKQLAKLSDFMDEVQALQAQKKTTPVTAGAPAAVAADPSQVDVSDLQQFQV